MTHPTRQARLHTLDRHIERLERQIHRLQSTDNCFPWYRLAAFLGGGLASFLTLYYGPPWLGRVVAVASIGVFAWVVYQHRRLDHSRLRFELARCLTADQLARLNLDWTNIPPTPPTPASSDHPFDLDLNLTGGRSLHQLLDTAASLGGSQRLRDWLLAPVPDLAQMRHRQALVNDLLPRRGLYGKLALNGALVARSPEQWDGEKLRAWLTRPVERRALERSLIGLGLLAFANLILLVLNLAGILPPLWAGTLTIYALAYLFSYRAARELFDEAIQLEDALHPFMAVLAHLEAYPYAKDSPLADLCRPFWEAPQRPSRQLHTIIWLVAAAGIQKSPLLWLPLNLLMPWDFFFTLQLDRYKARLRNLLPQWLDTWYELEALSALANFAYLNPDYTFPEVLDQPEAPDQPLFEAHALGHPLLPAAEKICNDFSIEDLRQIAIITGSNMSGKSTFLRTLGVNLCLAYAGGPVNASRLRVAPLRLFTCINVSDSLSDGISYFYAEVRRLKALLDALEDEHAFPVLFLIDEIFRGTNNRERQIGSRAYIRALATARGVGVISTHDLELIHLSEQMPGVHNFHFREEVAGDHMTFDYRLRPGPCPTTNALRIMALAGLPVG